MNHLTSSGAPKEGGGRLRLGLHEPMGPGCAPLADGRSRRGVGGLIPSSAGLLFNLAEQPRSLGQQLIKNGEIHALGLNEIHTLRRKCEIPTVGPGDVSLAVQIPYGKLQQFTV